MLETGFRRKGIYRAFKDFKNEKRHTLHRLNLLGRMGLVGRLGDLVFKRALSYRELKAAYALSHRIFILSDYLESDWKGMRLREWELSPATATFVAQTQKSVVGVTTLACDIADKGLPSEWLYGAEFNTLRCMTKKMAEASNEAVDFDYRNFSIPFEFFRLMLAHCWHDGIDTVVAVVNKNHKTFYEFLYMAQLSGEKNYSANHFDPVILMGLDCAGLFGYLSSSASEIDSADRFLRDYLLYNNPYRNQVPAWNKKAKIAFQRQRIKKRFLDGMKNTFVVLNREGLGEKNIL